MSVEETSQLIQLILNSVLMVVACVIVLSGLLVRHTAVNNRLKAVSEEYFELMGRRNSSELSSKSHYLLYLKRQLHHLRQRYKLAHSSVLTMHCALFVVTVSAFMMIARTVIHWNWLINGSLLLSTFGLGILLVGVLLAALDLYLSRRGVWDEMNWLLTLGEGHVIEIKPKALPPIATVRRSPRRPRRLLKDATM